MRRDGNRADNLLRLGAGSACPGERLEPAIELVEKGNIDYIVFDSLSESEMLAFERHKMSQRMRATTHIPKGGCGRSGHNAPATGFASSGIWGRPTRAAPRIWQ